MMTGMALESAILNQVNRTFDNTQYNATTGGTNSDAPPPLPANLQYYIAVNGQPAGPFDLKGLEQQLTSGSLTPQTLVWKKGMASWVLASSVAEIAPVLENLPPPLP